MLITRIGTHKADGDGILVNVWTKDPNPAPVGSVSAASLRGAAMLAWLAAPALAQDNVVATATLPRDLSPWGMYLNADPVVKAVLIGLVSLRPCSRSRMTDACTFAVVAGTHAGESRSLPKNRI